MDTKTGECGFVMRNGETCTRRAIEGLSGCYSHAPELADVRRENASKGGKAGGRGRAYPATYELTRLAERLERTADQVISGNIDKGKAVIVGQLLNASARAWSASARVKETERLEEEIEILRRMVYGEPDPLYADEEGEDGDGV
jgi:hypothetical protein